MTAVKKRKNKTTKNLVFLIIKNELKKKSASNNLPYYSKKYILFYNVFVYFLYFKNILRGWRTLKLKGTKLIKDRNFRVVFVK